MLQEFTAGNCRLTEFLPVAHAVCDKNNDVALATLIETWIDDRTPFIVSMGESRTRDLIRGEASSGADNGGVAAISAATRVVV
jgi:hypothetical protein